VSATATLRAWLELVRLPAVFSVWSNILAAHLIASGGDPRWHLLALQLGISTSVYWGGMILNDCFDLSEDRRERPERPLPSGRLAPPSAWAAGSGLLLIGLLLALAAGERVLWVTLLLTAAVLLYDGRLKGGPLGPLAMGLCRYLNWLLGLAVVPILSSGLALALPVLFYTMGVTNLSRGETGSGMRPAIVSAGLMLIAAALALLGLHLAGVQSQPLALVIAALLALVIATHLWRLYRAPTPERLRKGVGLLLMGMIPLDAVLLLGDDQALAATALLLLILPGRLLVRRLAIT
jgi:4-hydroxybenzoate polyprenyltransferase